MYLSKHILIALIASVLILPSCSSQTKKQLPAASSVPYYLVSVNEDDIREVNVEAILPLVRDTIRMSQSDFEPLPNGFAEFVSDLSATDSKGNRVGLESVGKGIWKVSTPMPATVRLKYFVSIKHESVRWAVSSAFARAYTVDKVLFFAGRTMFIAANGQDDSKIKVQYNIPAGWDVATPYEELESSGKLFQAKNLSELWRNGNFIGKFDREEIGVGKLQITLAGTPSMKEGLRLFKGALEKIVNTYQSEMGGAPEGKLVIMGSVAQLQQGGEAFNHSISVMFNQPPTMANKSFWGYLLAHEIFHLWNGGALYTNDQSKVEWFVEGFTEYMSKVAQYRTGFTSEDEFLRQANYSIDSYRGNAGKIAMTDAGIHKGENYSFIYDGGFSVALALDIQTRRATHNQKGVIDILRAMYSKFGGSHTPYTYQDIINVSGEVSGTDLSGFFNDYVSGTKVMPFSEYLGYAGLEIKTMQGQKIILPKAYATDEEKNLMKAVLYK